MFYISWSVCLCSFILQFYVLDFLRNCSFLFTEKFLCLVVHEVDHGDPVEYEAAEAKVEVAEVKVEAGEVKVMARFREKMLQQWLLSDEVKEGRRVAAAMVM